MQLPKLLCAVLFLCCTAPASHATDFSLLPREPGPGHRVRSYWWTFNGAAWELTPPEGFLLQGGGELRLGKNNDPGIVAVCRETTAAERALLEGDDKKAQADFVRTMLPGGISDVRLVSQSKNPLPVNGLTNFEVSYAYTLGGIACQLSCVVSQGGEPAEQSPPVPGRPAPKPAPSPKLRANGQPMRSGAFFTTIVSGPSDRQPAIYGAFQQLMATARIKVDAAGADDPKQYVSHGMLGR